MADAILTPFDLSETIPAGRRRFWKQILPLTTIDYKGHKIKFDKRFHMDLADSFRKEAYDQVPVVFADGENRHNMNPRNFGGDVLDMQARPTGLFALVEADKDAAKAIQRNPKLGVSARIVQGLEKADGRKFGRAIQHVLLTMNPRVSGLEPWQAVDLSEEDADIEVVDLTAETYKEGTDMGTTVTKPTRKSPTDRKAKAKTAPGKKIDLSALSDEQFESLVDLATAALADPDADLDEDADDELDEDTVENTTTVTPRKKKSKTKITVEKESEDDGDDTEDEGDDDEVTELSDADKVQRDEDRATVRGMQIDLAEERWKSDRTAYVLAGVPPFLLDLAEPVLSQPDTMTIDLADGESADPADIIRQMIDGVKGLIDLTPEIGHQMDLSEGDEVDSDKAFLDEWSKQYG